MGLRMEHYRSAEGGSCMPKLEDSHAALLSGRSLPGFILFHQG